MTNLVMVMPYKAYVHRAQLEGLRICAIWDPKVAQSLYGAKAQEYLADLAQRADAFVLTDFSDHERFARVVRKAVSDFEGGLLYHLGGEDSMLATYRIAEELGVAVNPLRSIELLNDKLAMRRLLAEHGLSAVRFADAESWSEVAGLLDGFDLPVVVKPTRLSGSRGVFLLREPAQLRQWGRLLDSYDYHGPVLVEEYLAGPEYSVETLSDHGRHLVIGVTRKVLGPPPLFVEAGHVHPVPDSAATREMSALTVELLELAGYQCGPAHTEIIWTSAGPRIVESQARLGGDQIPRLVELSTGLDIERAIFAILAGRSPAPGTGDGVARISYFDLPPGVLRSVSGLDEARALDFVADLHFPFVEGDRIPETIDWRTRHGYVVVTGESEAQTLARAQQVRALVAARVEQSAVATAVEQHA